MTNQQTFPKQKKMEIIVKTKKINKLKQKKIMTKAQEFIFHKTIYELPDPNTLKLLLGIGCVPFTFIENVYSNDCIQRKDVHYEEMSPYKARLRTLCENNSKTTFDANMLPKKWIFALLLTYEDVIKEKVFDCFWNAVPEFSQDLIQLLLGYFCFFLCVFFYFCVCLFDCVFNIAWRVCFVVCFDAFIPILFEICWITPLLMHSAIKIKLLVLISKEEKRNMT